VRGEILSFLLKRMKTAGNVAIAWLEAKVTSSYFWFFQKNKITVKPLQLQG
jgi:hypothetical protein